MPFCVLFAASTRWISTARLAMAFAETGCRVDALCRSNHPMLLTRAVCRQFSYSQSDPVGSMKESIRASKPELLVCCDETTLRLAHTLYEIAVATGDDEMKTLMERSLGSLASLEIVLSRPRFLAEAVAEGLAVPATCVVESASELAGIGGRLGWPLVLKTDGSSGGNGVRIVNDGTEAEAAWKRLHEAPGLLRRIHYELLNGRFSLGGARRTSFPVVGQRMVEGREATVAVACWRGEILAAHCLEVVETWSERGPSSVLRVVDAPEMLNAACRMVRRLKLSGMCGFDFIVETTSGVPQLIEMNVRPTQTSHLPLGVGKDLVSALVNAATGESQDGRSAVTELEYLALFPQELQRNEKSEWLQRGYHDVPKGEPALVKAATSTHWSGRYAALARFVRHAGSR